MADPRNGGLLPWLVGFVLSRVGLGLWLGIELGMRLYAGLSGTELAR